VGNDAQIDSGVATTSEAMSVIENPPLPVLVGTPTVSALVQLRIWIAAVGGLLSLVGTLLCFFEWVIAVGSYLEMPKGRFDPTKLFVEQWL
jgi:hypothetical protein